MGDVVSPRLFGSAEFSRREYDSYEVAVVRTDYHPRHNASTAYHEAWHLADDLMGKETLAKLDAQLATAPRGPGTTTGRRGNGARGRSRTSAW